MIDSSKPIRIDPRDNVAVAIQNLPAGTVLNVDGIEIVTREPVDRGHKIALADIAEGAPIIKYGWPIAHATVSIEAGQWIHTHNAFTNLSGIIQYTYTPDFQPSDMVEEALTFDGYVRPDGEIGIRNEIWIVPTVGCVNEIARTLACRMNETCSRNGVDGVFAWTHPYGCSQMGDDLKTTREILAGLVRHPNAAGVLVIGLGCEDNTMDDFRAVIGTFDPDRVKFLLCQNEDDEIEAGIGILDRLMENARHARREPVPVDRLRIGLECGGSDGLSGLTGNPLAGVVSDRLIALGGTAVLSEVPEMFGAEHLLMNRCVDRDVFERCVRLINDWKDFFIRNGQVIYDNPAPGNKDGGLTTLEEKSLGCIQKGGSSPVTDVLNHGDRLKKRGLNLLTGPGNDPVSVTLLAAAGVHLILFTTGRGTPFGSPVPTLKISTNSELAARKKNWIDFNAGVLLEGESLNDAGDRLFKQVLDTASGLVSTRNEVNQFREIALLKTGVTV